MHARPTQLKLLNAAMLGLAAFAASQAHATLITNQLGVSGSAKAETNPEQIFGLSTDPSYVSGYASDSSGNNYAYAGAWGNQYGVYRASASGDGVFDSLGRFHRTVTLTNDNAFDTDYSLSFYIYGGGIYIYDYGVTGSGAASYALNILKNGSSQYASAASLTSAGALTETGSPLNNASLTNYGGANYYYSWSGTSVVLNLGTLAPGGSMTVDFDLLVTASGNFGSRTETYCYYGGGGYGDAVRELMPSIEDGYGGDGYGGDGYGGGGELVCYDRVFTGYVSSGLGDPNDFSGSGQNNPFLTITGVPSNQNSVPLPGTLALLGAGLLGFGLQTRRRKH